MNIRQKNMPPARVGFESDSILINPLPMITIREFDLQIKAALVQSFLLENEIDSVLMDENTNLWSSFRPPIRLQVCESQVEAAMALLKQFDQAPAISDDE